MIFMNILDYQIFYTYHCSHTFSSYSEHVGSQMSILLSFCFFRNFTTFSGSLGLPDLFSPQTCNKTSYQAVAFQSQLTFLEHQCCTSRLDLSFLFNCNLCNLKSKRRNSKQVFYALTIVLFLFIDRGQSNIIQIA